MKTTILLVMMVAMVSCSRQSDSTPALKISVLKDGTILADGEETALPDLDRALTELEQTGGTVWYYREAGQEEPPPQAMEVIKLLADKSLPIMLSSQPDFSDYIGEDGRSLPRKK
jgi:hypothetical protein